MGERGTPCSPPGDPMNIYLNDPMRHKIYLAGPFFNEDQLIVAAIVEQLAEAANLDHFSPRLRCCCPPDATIAQRKLSFDMNVEAITNADLVLARIDDFDPGTMWEIGYAYGVSVPVYAYTTVEGRGLNLMLAQSCKGFIKGLDELEEFIGGNGMVSWNAAHKIHNGVII